MWSGGSGEFEHASPLAEKALASARTLEEERPDLAARALVALARVELVRGRLEEAAAYAEEGAALSRELADRPPPRRLFPSMGPTAEVLLTSWRADAKTMESQSLTILALARILQGGLHEGIRVAREALSISRELHERAETRGSLALGAGLVESGDYEEALEICRRGTDLARELPNVFLLWLNLNHLGRAYEALLDLEEARRVHEEALELSRALGPQYGTISSIRLSAVAALSEDWEEAYAHARRAHEAEAPLDMMEGLYLHYVVEALLRGGDERLAREEVGRFAERAEVNERNRISYLRYLAILSEFEGDLTRAVDYLREALLLAQNLGVPGELWQIQSRIGYLHERRGENGEALEAFSGAARTLGTLAQKIGDEKLREGFLSAPQVRRVLGHDQLGYEEHSF